MEKTIPHLLLIVPDMIPSAMIYIIKPLEVLAQQGKILFHTVIEEWANLTEVRIADIVLFCRNIEPERDWILQECQARHIPMVYHLDDNFWEMPLGFEYSEHILAPPRIAQLERYLRKVDQVRVYSRPLEERARAFNPDVAYVHPCIDLRPLPSEPPARKSERIRITYVTGRGSVDPLVDLFADDLQRLLDEHPGRFEFVWWGEAPDRFRGYPDCSVVKVLNDYDQFIQFLATEGFDIGLAPLTPTSFNLSKTNTKFRDYGACHIAGLYSAVEVYTGCVEPGKTGLLVSQKPGAWYEAMLQLSDDVQLREAIRRNAYKEVYEHYRQELTEAQWLETIQKLLAQRPVFAQALPEGTIYDVTRLAELEPDSLDALALDGALNGLVDPAPALVSAYRAVRHGGQLSIYAAYRKSPANLDEYSPLHWSSETAPVYTRQDNLSGMEASPRNVPPGLDLRCWDMEFFYNSTARLLNESDRRQARQSDSAVYDAILYRCQVVKKPLEAETLPPVWIDPTTVTVRRETEQVEEIKGGLRLAYASLDEARRRTSEIDLDIKRSRAEIDRQLPLARQMAHEVDAYRNRKLLRLIGGLRDRTNFIHHQPPAVQRWVDDSLLFFGRLDGFFLRPSQSLTRLASLEYFIDLLKPGLRQISFMPLFDLYPRQGALHCEVRLRESRLAEAEIAASEIRAETPVVFSFLPLPAGRLALRLSGKDLDVPLRIYEWQHPTWLGLGRPLSRPFVSLTFATGV